MNAEMLKRKLLCWATTGLLSIVLSTTLWSQTKLLIPMDLTQTDHLKAYGVVYWFLTRQENVDWLLNYRGGAFMVNYTDVFAGECRIRGVSFIQVDAASALDIYKNVQSEGNNMDVVRLEKAPKVAIYVPPDNKPWDDAVTLAMQYAEIPYEKVWDEDILQGKLSKYDWLHLHHEDFTGQYGKFYGSYNSAPWYITQQIRYEQDAHRLGFKKVSEEKVAVARAIKEYIANGGFMFTMCAATDSYDIALAADGVDICDVMFDGDPPDPGAQEKLDFTKGLAFENYRLHPNPFEYEFSDIDVQPQDVLRASPDADYFTLFDFSAKYDPVPSMLTQCHVNVVRGFFGQTTSFHKQFVKKSVIILAQKDGTDEVKYIHGNLGRGTFTYYGGHDPEDYQHQVGDPPTDLSLHKNSPGYRLILNNILFPAAKKKEQKT